MSEKSPHAAADAFEMKVILQTASCMSRYNQISHQLLAEILVAIATDGEVIGGNNLGSDVKSPTHGLIEVKSRILGSDGPFPRVSLKQRNLDKSSWIAAIRWDRKFVLYDAVMLPKTSAQMLFNARKQKKDLAHIVWQDWISAPHAKSIKSECSQALRE